MNFSQLCRSYLMFGLTFKFCVDLDVFTFMLQRENECVCSCVFCNKMVSVSSLERTLHFFCLF